MKIGGLGLGLGKIVRSIAKAIGGNKICVACNSKILIWLPYPLILELPDLSKHFEIIGSDPKNFNCPICGSHDRERHLILFFQKTEFLSRCVTNKSILHFAPEQHLAKIITNAAPKKYSKCDLYPTTSNIEKIDMLEIPYESKTFDLVIANHVLEHVLDDHLALSELHRVLKINGFALLQTPFSAKLNVTLDDSGIDTDFLRTQIFGQIDHVRLYGKDIFDRFASHGFVPCISYHKELLNDFDAKIYGVNEREPFMLFQRIGTI